MTEGSRSVRRNLRPHVTLPAANTLPPTWSGLGSKPILRGESPTTDRLNCGGGMFSRNICNPYKITLCQK